MTGLTVRRALPADAALVPAMTRAAYQKWVPVIGREPRPMTADYDRAVVEHRIDIFESDGVPVALIEMKPEPDHLLIVNVTVHPDRQSEGIGSGLLRHAEEIAGSLGLAEMRLYTNGAFVSNIALYRHRGYHETHREEIGQLGIAVHMAKRIGAG